MKQGYMKMTKQCECDPKVGFFCAHCCLENQYIQDLQNKFLILESKLAIVIESLEYLNTITVLPEKVKPVIKQALAKYKS